MVEPIMFFGIGFLVAALLTIGAIPLVHARAVRLTRKRLEASTPVSLAEIQADKDQLRAEFAMSTRRLEMSVEQMKAKTTSQLTEISKKGDAISKLKSELAEKTAALMAIEAREKAFRDQAHATEEEYAVKTASLREAERHLADKKAELDKMSMQLNDRSLAADSQKVEVTALRAQVEALRTRVEHFDREARLIEDRLEGERKEARAATQQLTDERGKFDSLTASVTELQGQLIAQTTEAELVSKRANDLELRLSEQGRLLAEREYEAEQLRIEIAAARKSETELRAAIDDSGKLSRGAAEALRTEKAVMEEQLRQSNDDRAKLQREVAAMKRDTESTWASERVENALLRERINDVAAEVARLASALEGPDSPIDAILAGETLSSANGDDKVISLAPDGEPGRGSLADRIRLLQSRASRLPAN